MIDIPEGILKIILLIFAPMFLIGIIAILYQQILICVVLPFAVIFNILLYIYNIISRIFKKIFCFINIKKPTNVNYSKLIYSILVLSVLIGYFYIIYLH